MAKRIITGRETNKEGVRLIHVVYRLDVFASDTLNKLYVSDGSFASIHTYNGGNQVISTKHKDRTEGSFNSNGTNKPTNNMMDIEVLDYVNR